MISLWYTKHIDVVIVQTCIRMCIEYNLLENRVLKSFGIQFIKSFKTHALAQNSEPQNSEHITNIFNESHIHTTNSNEYLNWPFANFKIRCGHQLNIPFINDL